MVVEQVGKMDTVEVTKMIDSVYKNILDNFNPTSRQMIAAGKAYLKSLHGASAACSMYLDSLVKLSRQAQQSSFGCSSDIGSSLMQVSEVFKEIHTQQLNTLKAFYVDFLAPLEANLEKDTRVIQGEQKKFLMCHKQKVENFTKAASTVKKMRKKTKKANNSSTQFDKELKVMQAMEEERGKLESFCEKSMKEALIQERRRYGFILERKASLAKHYVAFYYKGSNILQPKLEAWNKLAKSRETLPEPMQNALLKRIQGGGGNGEDECIYCNPPSKAALAQKMRSSSIGARAAVAGGSSGGFGLTLGAGSGLILLRQQSVSAKHTPTSSYSHALANSSADDSFPGGGCTIVSQLRKTKSMDASEIVNSNCEQDLPITMTHGAPVAAPNGGIGGGGTLCRAKSDLNLGSGNNGNGNGNGMQCCNGLGHVPMPPGRDAAVGPDAPDSYIIETTTPGMLSNTSSSSSPSHQSAFHEPTGGMTMTSGGGTLLRSTQNQNHAQGQHQAVGGTMTLNRPKSLALLGQSGGGSSGGAADNTSGSENDGGAGAGFGFVKARYAYLSSGENQLCFLEGDAIALIGERNNGWQYGENLRTQKTGWFPIAYTEAEVSCSTGGSGNVNTIMNGHVGHGGHAHAHGSQGHSNSNSSAEEGFCSLSPIPPPIPPALPTPVANMHMQLHAPGCAAGGSGGNSSFQQKRMNLADVLVHRSGSAIKSLPSTPAGCCTVSGGASHLKSPGTPSQQQQQQGPGGASVSMANSSTQTINSNSLGLMIHPPPPATTPTATTANSGRSASDSLHSSNDSGFSNDLNNQRAHAAGAGAGGPMLLHMLPPPQPDIDYSDDEPQLSNSQEFKSGDEWLMDKYHQSESIRLGNLDLGVGQPPVVAAPKVPSGSANVRPRRSLSFGNVSGWENMHPNGIDDRDADYNTLRDRISRHQYSHEAHYLPSELARAGRHGHVDAKNEGGALKKLINRTKSFIWKKKDDDPEFDSVSVIGSLADIWGSHNSLVDVNYTSKNSYEMKELNNKEAEKPMVEAPSHPAPSKPRREALPTPPPPPPTTQAQSTQVCTKKSKSTGEARNGNGHTLQYQGTKGKSKGRRLARVDSNSESEAPIIPTGHHVHMSSKHRSTTTGPSAASNGKKYRSKLHSASSAGAGMKTLDGQNSVSVKRRPQSKGPPQADPDDEDEYNTLEFDDETEGAEQTGADTNVEDDDNDNASSVFAQQSERNGKSSSSKKSNGIHYLVKSNSFRRKLRLGGGSTSPKSHAKKSQSMRISHASFATTTSTSVGVGSKSKNSSNDKRYRLVNSQETGSTNGAPTSTSMDIAKLNNTIVTTLQNAAPKSRIKGSIHSEFHTVELIATGDDDSDESAAQTSAQAQNGGGGKNGGGSKNKKGDTAMFEYGNQIHKRLYYPERSSKLDQKSERSGNLCGPWYDLWGCDQSVPFA